MSRLLALVASDHFKGARGVVCPSYGSTTTLNTCTCPADPSLPRIHSLSNLQFKQSQLTTAPAEYIKDGKLGRKSPNHSPVPLQTAHLRHCGATLITPPESHSLSLHILQEVHRGTIQHGPERLARRRRCYPRFDSEEVQLLQAAHGALLCDLLESHVLRNPHWAAL